MAINMADSQGAWGEWLARDISCRESRRIVYNPLEEDQSIVRVEPRPIIGVDQVMIVPVLDIHIPAHKLHLEATDCGIATVVGEDKLESITVGDPSESLAKAHVVAFIDGVVPGECFAKVGMQHALVPLSATTSKCNRVEDSF